jgi:hypothetical protein
MLRGIHRYHASNFPFFIFLGRVLDGRARWLALYFVGGPALMALFAYLWGRGYQPN